MRVFKCLVPVLVALLVEGSSATLCLLREVLNIHNEHSIIGRICDSKAIQHNPTSAPPIPKPITNIINTGPTIQNGDGSIGTLGTDNTVSPNLRQSPTNGNGNVYSDAPGNAWHPPQYDTSAPPNLGDSTYVSQYGPTNQYGNGNVGSIGTYNEGSSFQRLAPSNYALTAVTDSQSKVNHIPNQSSGPSYGSRVPGVNSASKADAYAGSNVVGGVGGNAGNTGIMFGSSASSRTGLGRYGGSNRGSVSVNAKADAVATAGASSGSWTDGSNGSRAYQQDSFGGLSSAISNAHSNAFGGSASSSGKSTANFFGNAMAQSSSSAISTDGRSSASSYASASAHTNV